MAGMVSRDHLLLLIQHAGITRAATWSILEPRWPDVAFCDVNNTEPSAWLTVEDPAALARRRRGVEPIRIVIAAQLAAMTLREQWGEPMPMLI